MLRHPLAATIGQRDTLAVVAVSLSLSLIGVLTNTQSAVGQVLRLGIDAADLDPGLMTNAQREHAEKILK